MHCSRDFNRLDLPNCRFAATKKRSWSGLCLYLLLFYEAGFSIADILQIATYTGAMTMHLEERLGTIAVGKQADLVIFHEDPFEDANNFIASKTVIKSGKVYAPKIVPEKGGN